MTPQKNNVALLFLCLLFVVPACSGELQNYAVMQEAYPSGWSRQQPLSFEIPVYDSVSLYRVDITGRLQNTYFPNSLSVALQVTAPSGDWFRDTVCFVVTHAPNRLWDDFRAPYCSHIRFAEKGVWRFTVWQQMDVESLKGVSALGFYIEKE